MSRFCTGCGNELRGDAAFCTVCGKRVAPEPDGTQLRQNHGFGGFSGPEPEDPLPDPKPPRPRGNGVLYAIIGLLTVLLIAAIVIIATGVLAPDRAKDDEDDRADPSPSASVAEPEQDSAKGQGEPEDEPSPTVEPGESGGGAANTTPTSGEKQAVTDLLDGFYDAFIDDVNDGSYYWLDDYVQRGSPMEAELRKFLVGCAEREQWEALLRYEIQSWSKTDENTILVTVAELYDVKQNVEPYYWWIDQKCVYRVCRQSDGSWKVYEYAEDIVALDMGVY